MKVKYKMTCMLPEIEENISISIKLCQKNMRGQIHESILQHRD